MKWIIASFLIICSLAVTIGVVTPPLDNEDAVLMEQVKPFLFVIIGGLLVSAIWVIGATYGAS